MDLIRANRLVAAILSGLVVVLALVLVLLLSRGGDSAPVSEVASTPSTVPTEVVASTEAPGDPGRADIPSLGCESLLTQEAIDDR